MMFATTTTCPKNVRISTTTTMILVIIGISSIVLLCPSSAAFQYPTTTTIITPVARSANRSIQNHPSIGSSSRDGVTLEFSRSSPRTAFIRSSSSSWLGSSSSSSSTYLSSLSSSTNDAIPKSHLEEDEEDVTPILSESLSPPAEAATKTKFTTLPRHNSHDGVNDILSHSEGIIQGLHQDSMMLDLEGEYSRIWKDGEEEEEEDIEGGGGVERVFSNHYVDMGKVSLLCYAWFCFTICVLDVCHMLLFLFIIIFVNNTKIVTYDKQLL